MPQVILAPAAIRDMQRLREFLSAKSLDAARRAGEAIRQGVQVLGLHPMMGRLVEDLPEQYREWLIDFGDSGYAARYRIDGDIVIVTILAVRHQKEVEYRRLSVSDGG